VAVSDPGPRPPPPPDFGLPPDTDDAGTDDAGNRNPFGITFTNVTLSALGGQIEGGRSPLNNWGAGTGAAIGDLDGDGLNDIILSRNDDPTSDKPGGPSLFLRNTGPTDGGAPGPTDGGAPGPHFAVDPDFSALVSLVKAHGVALGDYDRDGDLDVFLAVEGTDILLQNDGTGHFTDVTATAGVGGRSDDLSTGALFADFNHDGLLDLYVTNFNKQPAIPNLMAKNRLFINLGDGTFTDVSFLSGTDSTGATHVAAAFDFDGDGDLGLYLANDRFSSLRVPGNVQILPDAWYQLQRVNPEGIPLFTNVASQRGVVAWRSSMGIGIADVDGDLTPDLYISDIGKKWLYLNKQPGGPVTDAEDVYSLGFGRDANLYIRISWGLHFLDLDRDGTFEALVNHGYIYDPAGCDTYQQVPLYLRGRGPQARYDNITASVGMAYHPPVCPGGVGDPNRATNRAVVVGDLDGDGDDDVVFTPFGSTYEMWRNDTVTPHHAIRVRLRGTVSSSDPIGATLLTTRLDGTQAAQFRYAGGDTGSQSEGLLTQGLGDDNGVTRVDVKWPSGLTQRIDQLSAFALDRVVVVREPAWLTLEPRVLASGDPPAQLVYTAVDEQGQPLGAAGAGRTVIVIRSDGKPVTVTDQGDGTYTAPIVYPGAPHRATVTVYVNGVVLRQCPMVVFK
jgi:hypothetical protein